MKKHILSLVLALVVAQVSAFGAGPSVDPERGATSEMLAQLLAGFQPNEYRGWFSHERPAETIGVSRSHYVDGEFRLDADKQVVYVEIDGVVIHDDPSNPLPTLPSPIVAVSDFSISLSALVNGDTVMYGYANNGYYEPGEAITIMLRPDWQVEFVAYEPPAGVDPENLRLRTEGGEVAEYNQNLGGFRVWCNPLDGEQDYQIYDASTGEVLASGTVSPVSVPATDEGHHLNLTYIDGITSVMLDPEQDQWYSDHPAQTFTGQSDLGGERVVSKTFIVERDEYSPTVLFLGDFQGQVQAWEYRQSGEMPNLPLAVSSSQQEVAEIADLEAEIEESRGPVAKAGGPSDWSVLSIPAGPAKVIVTVFGNEDSDGAFDAIFAYGEGGIG
ncbi:MAG: hypothetical protein A2571_00055 [Candidatus Vogelbacteria bacterium RIFOXYD1_FULL_44_32]|uniref:PepSY domain-containing protein n=1 Tax=Candidatus Vogelbacteria bacterium RIFOXYD1_FULL_44_32 TaxID=1802438 RepID=A0A1G2QDU8_9BACT|nr:MAG: hypothetical protein A2571_00055 [Candidatus Vogelbacteria bacterium RIFOXYD1_FULL_44_32]